MVGETVSIAVASGKGGTGKTTVSLALARCAAESASRGGAPCALLDCDVEEPNDALFLFRGKNPDDERDACILVPSVDANACSACGECARFCRFNAIAVLGKAMPFPELCHGCGGCALVCPTKAIREIPRPIGRVRSWTEGGFRLIEGELSVGMALSPPLIREVKRTAAALGETGGLAIIDAPPGSSCPMAAAISGSDAVLLVTEPTPFGLNDLKLALASVRGLGIPCAVLINRDGSGSNEAEAYCAAEGVPVIGKIREDRKIAETCARGAGLLDAAPEFRPLMESVLAYMLRLAGRKP